MQVPTKAVSTHLVKFPAEILCQKFDCLQGLGRGPVHLFNDQLQTAGCRSQLDRPGSPVERRGQ